MKKLLLAAARSRFDTATMCLCDFVQNYQNRFQNKLLLFLSCIQQTKSLQKKTIRPKKRVPIVDC